MSYWTGKRVVVTGGGGFLGSFVVEKLRERGCEQICVPRSKDYDLRDIKAIRQLFADASAASVGGRRSPVDIVIHLGGVAGGIGANRKHPARFFYDNAIMGLQLIELARQFEVEKFVCVGTVCSYPKFTPVPFREESLWNGYPEETNAPYGLAKKMLLVQLQAYRQQYGFNGIYLIPVNLYGPRDNFDVESCHVIPAIIHKCVEAKRTGALKIVAWGSGKPTREFLYVEDAAEAIVLAAERYDKPDPMNLGSGREIRIYDLVELVKELAGFEGQVEWDESLPDGQPARRLDTSRALEELGWRAKTSLRDGLRRTIEWFGDHYKFQRSSVPGRRSV